MRELSARRLNRALLARQLLLHRPRLSVVQAVERVGGLQAQYAPSAYIGLWSRLAAFERSHLTGALERRRVVQGTLMRVTIHIVSARDYPLLVAAIAEPRRASWLKARKDVAARDVEAAARRVQKLLGGEPRSRAELGDGLDATTWNGVGMWLDLVRVPPSGTWERRRADLYAAADDWLGASDATAEAGCEHLLRRYLGAFVPTTLNDTANWAGVPARSSSTRRRRTRSRPFWSTGPSPAAGASSARRRR